MSTPYLQLCTDSQLRQFYADFDATPETINRDVQHLIKWLEKQPHLPNVQNEDWLANFLLRCKNSVERTKQRLEFYFISKAMLAQVFQVDDFNILTQELEKFILVPMRKLTPDGHRVLITQICEHNAENLPSADAILRGMQLMFDHLLKIDKVRGVTLIYDGKNMSMPLIATLLQAAKKFTLIHSKINPIRYNKVYLLNFPSYGQSMVNFITTIVKKEANKLVMWKEEVTKLNTVISKECLPKEYGGNEPSLIELRELMYNESRVLHFPWLRTHIKIAADLSKKPEKLTLKHENDDTYGIDGSFRKLRVD